MSMVLTSNHTFSASDIQIDLKSDDLWNCSWRILALVVSIPSYPSETSGELWCHLKTGIRRANLVQWVVSLKEPFHIFGGGWVGGGRLASFYPFPTTLMWEPKPLELDLTLKTGISQFCAQLCSNLKICLHNLFKPQAAEYFRLASFTKTLKELVYGQELWSHIHNYNMNKLVE